MSHSYTCWCAFCWISRSEWIYKLIMSKQGIKSNIYDEDIVSTVMESGNWLKLHMCPCKGNLVDVWLNSYATWTRAKHCYFSGKSKWSMYGFNSILLDIDECLNPSTNDCDLNAVCIDKEGYHICVCHQGYIGNGWQCYGMYTHIFTSVTPCQSCLTKCA